MIKRDPKKISEDIAELKAHMKIGEKMFKDAYHDESKRLKEMERMMMKAINSKTPVTEGDLCTGFALMYRELQSVLTQTHIGHLSYVKDVVRFGEINLALNAVFAILKDVSDKTRDKPTSRRIKKIEVDLKKALNFQDDIINKVNQKQIEAKKSKDLKFSFIT